MLESVEDGELMAKCKFCLKEITWMKDGRKNVPVDQDGGIHSCDEMKNSRSSLRTMNATSLSPEEIAKYEKGINDKADKAGKTKK